MQFAAHLNDRPANELYGRGPTREAAMEAARRQFAGAMQFWPAAKARIVVTEVPDDFRGKWEQ